MKERAILNTPGTMEKIVFGKLQRENLINIVCCLTWKDKTSLMESFGNAYISEGWPIIKAGLDGDYSGIDQRLFTPELKNELRWAEEIVLDMMARMDPSKCQTYHERKSLYKLLVCYWVQKLGELKPTLFYTRGTPHEVTDFVLFALCKYFGIKVILFNPLSLPGYYIISNDYRLPWAHLTEAIKKHNAIRDLDDNPERFNPDIQVYFKKLIGNYDEAKPQYFIEAMVAEQNASIKTNSITSIFNKSISIIKRSIRYGLKSFTLMFALIFKSNQGGIYQHTNQYRILKQHACARIVGHEFKMLPEIYRKLQAKSFTSCPYIYFLLQYQPENTTCPLGGIFNDQHMAIAVLAKSIPPDWKIYVKEHPGQYNTANRQYGYIGRDKTYYDRLISIPGVELIPIKSDHFKFLDNAMAISTITGTVGWEAVVRGKPVIVFGEAWYQDAPNVYRVRTSEDCSQAIRKIENMRIIDSVKTNSFVNAVSAASVKIFFEEFEARWAGEEFDFGSNSNRLYTILKSELGI